LLSHLLKAASRDKYPHQLPLLPDVAELVNTAAFKEAMMYHAWAEQIDGHYKSGEKQHLHHSNPGRPLSFRVCRIQIGCYLSNPPPDEATVSASAFMRSLGPASQSSCIIFHRASLGCPKSYACLRDAALRYAFIAN
jgi:hypothetical protein